MGSMSELRVFGLEGIGEVSAGDDLAAAILDAIAAGGERLVDDDIVVITHKVVSKQEGRVVEIPDEAAYRRLVEDESVDIIRRRGDLVIARTRHGFICANAAVDRSNVAAGFAVLLPLDPDRSAHRIRNRLEQATASTLGVIITDTFGRPWRRGLVDVAIGVSGVRAIDDLVGTTDTYGNVLQVTEVAVVDEVAAAADLVMGKATGTPAAVVRGLRIAGNGRAADLVRPASEDLFR
jgi:coenzyme F420-0:L-glutamate ligase/coenzyme F420-1:gamma-L-glutamate ligase